jgi:23S rRNA (cytidine2498-2'-O)-methyltransferase
VQATGYLAAEGYDQPLRTELGDVDAVHGRLMIARGAPRPAAWAQNVWLDPQLLSVRSITDAARQLRAMQRRWALYSFRLHRRAALIRAELPAVDDSPIPFPAELPREPLGSFTLLDEGTVLAAPRCTSPFPNGEVRFVEDRTGPPSRAYLKLWEAFLRAGVRPRPGERALDLGASPGGWTWALARLGARVTAVDKAALDPRVAALPGVTALRASAFALDPRDVDPVDWLVSDVVCYPARLLRLVERWLAAGRARNLICTLKFQGETDHATARAFAAIAGSALVHLHHNRNELTFLRIDQTASTGTP